MKVLCGMALRQTTGLVESLFCLIGLDWDVPDFGSLSRRRRTLAVNIPHRGSQGLLDLLIDSTGIKVEGEGEWNAQARRHQTPCMAQDHIGIDEKTPTASVRPRSQTHVRTARRGGAVPPVGLHPSFVTALPRRLILIDAESHPVCRAAIAERGAAAVIPPRKDAKPWKTVTAGATVRNEALRLKHLGSVV